MKIHSSITIGKKTYAKGDTIPWHQVYPFFMIHMLMFGGSGFFMAYVSNGPPDYFLYLHGGFAVVVYTVFYLAIFGPDEVKWMFINAALGLFGIWSQIGWIVSLFGRNIDEYPLHRHIIPFLYFVLYTFLLRNAVLDLANAREHAGRKTLVETAYVVIMIGAYAAPRLLYN